ncbi:MAG: HAD family hydrolase [Planctomycetota bacterium]|jgi:HAD superfamily hydrolase (TIGR01490 family)
MIERLPNPGEPGDDRAPAAVLRRAAFYDMDGTLVKGNVVKHYLFFALHAQQLGERARRITELAVRLPRYLALNRKSRRAFNEELYQSFRGITDDRLFMLKRDMFDKVTLPNLYAGAADLVRRDREAGHLTVLVTGALDVVAEPIAQHLGIDRVIANRLEIGADGLATGNLIPPVLAGPGKVAVMRELAAKEGIDLAASRAYSDDFADLPFLSAVGRAVATNPDDKLRAIAKAHRWPVLELGGSDREAAISRRDRARGLANKAFDGTLSLLRMLEPKKK